jgi:hypothetical protein
LCSYAICTQLLSASLALSAGAATLVPLGASWRYLADGSDQGTLWREPAPTFDDTSWSVGPAQLGYGDGDEATVIPSGPSGAHYITSYFRHHFNVADPGSVDGLELQLLRDDGAVVYLNGTEIYRSNMPMGGIGYLTPATTAVGGASESILYTTNFGPDLLVTGDNVVAVEVHQSSPTSSDVSLDFALLTAPAPGAPMLERGPYLQRATPNSIVVRWRTDTPTDTWLAYGAAPGSLTTTLSSPTLATEHVVEITGLAAFTKYFYAVGDSSQTLAGDDADHFFVTHPVAGTKQPIRIWVVGDSGECAANAQGCIDANNVANAYLNFAATNGNRPADVWLMLGDNAYTTGTDLQHTEGLFEVYPTILRSTVLWPVPGNHEFGASDSPTQTGPYYEAFTLPTAAEAGGVASGTEAYYSFDYGNVHFAALDSHDTDRSAPANPETNICPGGGQGGAMYNWLCDDLAATAQDWVITYWHHPPYTKGSHDSDLETQLIQVRERFAPVIEANGADLNLTGHSHSYERSVLLDGHYGDSASYVEATHAVDPGDGDPNGDGAYVKPNLGPDPNQGAVYSVVGSSSKNSGGLTMHVAMAYAENFEGSLVLDIDAGQLDGYWIDMNGVVKDHFRILKGPQNPPVVVAATPPQFRIALALAIAIGAGWWWRGTPRRPLRS